MGRVQVLDLPDLVIKARAEVGEGPVWDHRSERLCWVDINHGLLYEDDLIGGHQRVSSMGTMVGAVAPRQRASGFAVAVAEGFGFWSDGRLVVRDPVLPESYRRMNDAKCDSRGRLWAGSTHMDLIRGMGKLHCWDGRRPSVQIADGFTLPNGLGWSPDDTTMYLADSVTNQLLRAGFSTDEGSVDEFRPLCVIEPGMPDGLAVDMDGFIWVAAWGGSEVRRFSPSGEMVAVIPMPVTQPSSCAFGVDGTLYITSAQAGLSPSDLEQQPEAGSVFAIATETRGVPIHAFGA